MLTILAPHIDDEVIGCYSLIASGKVDRVVYFFDVTEERKAEAEKFAEVNGHEIVWDWKQYIPSPEDTLVIPSSKETHIQHLFVNAWAKQFPNPDLYYSIQMNHAPIDVLSAEDAKLKREMLDSVYPSQRELWAGDAKYYLFEHISEADGEVWAEITSRFMATHHWPDAPKDEKNLSSILRYPHRHEFHVTIRIQQFGVDRDVEFLTFKEQFKGKCLSRWEGRDVGALSCEIMAQSIRNWVQGVFFKQQPSSIRRVEVCVSEDGENGAWVK